MTEDKNWLDRAIAERVMGWNRTHDFWECGDPYYSYCKNCGITGHEGQDAEADGTPCPQPPRYSTDIALAFKVLELESVRDHFAVTLTAPSGDGWLGVRWYCRFDVGDGEAPLTIAAETAAKAICDAAFLLLTDEADDIE